MSDAAKPDPTTTAPTEGEKKPEEKPTTTTTEESKEGEKPAAPKTTDSVFSMFGGGPKKEKKEEEESQEAKDEPSGSSKAQKGEEEVGFFIFNFCVFLLLAWLRVGVGCFVDADSQPLSHTFYGWIELVFVHQKYKNYWKMRYSCFTGGSSRIP